MPDNAAEDQPPQPSEPSVTINVQITDTEAIQKFLEDLAALYETMAEGRLTIEAATDALGLVLMTFEGETL